MSNNLGAPRIADNQTSGQGRTANEALEILDGAVTAIIDLYATDSNSVSVSAATASSYLCLKINAASPAPTDTVDVELAALERGLMVFWNNLSVQMEVFCTGQSAPHVLVPPNGFALVHADGADIRRIDIGSPFIHQVEVFADTTSVTSGAAKKTFRMPARVWLTEVRGSLVTAQASGTAMAIDVNEAGASIFSTTLTFDNTEKTTVTAATPAVISDPAIADDAEITIDVDTVGTGGAGLRLTFIGIRY